MSERWGRLIGIMLIACGLFACTGGGSDEGLIEDGDVDGENGDAPDGDGLDGDSDSEPVDGDLTDGDGVDGDAPDGDMSDGDASDGDLDGSDGDADAEPEIERVTLELVEGCNPFATSDECLLPYPNMWFMQADSDSPTGYRGNFPPDMIPAKDGETHFDIDSANDADGASPVAPILVHFARDVHADFLTGMNNMAASLAEDAPIALVNLETGERVLIMTEMDANRNPRFEDRYALIIRPMEPMQMGVRHAVVLTNELTDIDGESFESPEAFAVLRDGVFTTNPEIEAVRAQYETMFTTLDAQGYARDEILLAWDFMVASEDWILGSTLSMRAEALDMAAGTGLAYTIDEVQDNPNENVSRIILGTFEVPTYLTAENDFVYDDDHHPVLQAENQHFPFTIVVPKMAETAGHPLPLLLFGHGIFGTGRSYLVGPLGRNAVQPLAQRIGVIVMATDWIGMSEGDMDIIIQEVIKDLNKIGLVTDRLQQSLINNITMTELAMGALNDEEDLRVADHPLIDEGKIYYYGVSLGGIQGSSFVALSPHIERAVLAVPGAGWSHMLPRSAVWSAIQLFFQAEYPDPLVRQIAVAFMQSRFDHSDPANLTYLLYADPLADAPAERHLLLQEAIGDSQVPNISTELLARAIGVDLLVPSVSEPAGLVQRSAPTTEPIMTQYYLQEQVDANPPPEGNLPPSKVNNAHYDVIFLGNVTQQVETFITTGQVELYCEGACDPN